MTHPNMNTPTPDYGELWTIQEGHLSTSLFDGKGAYFADIHELVGEDSSVAWAKADRIVACVNACAGMTDPAKEIAELRQALSGRTVSCEQCNEASYKLVGFEAEVDGLRAENQAMREAIREAHNAIKASPYPDQQALAKLKPFIK
jgi:hypothetical protein